MIVMSADSPSAHDSSKAKVCFRSDGLGNLGYIPDRQNQLAEYHRRPRAQKSGRMGCRAADARPDAEIVRTFVKRTDERGDHRSRRTVGERKLRRVTCYVAGVYAISTLVNCN